MQHSVLHRWRRSVAIFIIFGEAAKKYSFSVNCSELAYNHTGGLVDYIDLAEKEGILYSDSLTAEKSLEHLENHQIADFPVETKYEYSNTGYFLLSLVVEKASGKSLREFSNL